MDIFKLIFEHDLRLDELRERKLDRNIQEVTTSLEDFMKPDPTYSKFYISGTLLDEEKFGLNCLLKYPQIVEALYDGLDNFQVYLHETSVGFKTAVENAKIGWPIILTERKEKIWDQQKLVIDQNSNIGHKKSELAEVLKSGDLVLYKENAHQGFDLHLFSKDNIYPKLFYPLRGLVSNNFRFFSINGKRVRSEKQFYFETWTLERPPHGAEEVFSDTRI